MSGLDRFSKYLGNALAVTACAAIFLMMMHIVADIAGKFLFNRPVESTLEIVEVYYMVIVVFLPFAYVTRSEGQIAVELFTRGLSGRRFAMLECAVGAVTLVAMAVLTWKTGEDAVARTVLGELRESGADAIVVWPGRWALPFGCGVMALAVLMRLIRDVQRCLGRR